MANPSTATAQAGEGDQLAPDTDRIADELAALSARVRTLTLTVEELQADFDSNAKRVEDALTWVVAVVKEIREAGIAGLMRGTKRKARQ